MIADRTDQGKTERKVQGAIEKEERSMYAEEQKRTVLMGLAKKKNGCGERQ